jgi:hypothetical protein
VARATARQISFADVELLRQGVRLEPLLEAISKFLDSQHEMIERVRLDLVRGLKKPRKGRRGLTAPQAAALAGCDARQELSGCNSTWRTPILAKNGARRPGKFSRTAVILSPVHRHN